MSEKASFKSRLARILKPLLIVAFMAAFAVTFIPRTASFDLSASTEYVEVVTSESYPPTWYLSLSQFSNGSEASHPFTGSIKVAPSVRIVLQRIGTGPIYGELTPAEDSVRSCGTISAAGESTSAALGNKVVFKISDVPLRSATGQSTVFSLGGQIRLGSSGQIPASQFNPLLRQGQITVLGQNILGSDLYKGTPQLLEPGDVVIFEKPVGPANGLATVDERPGINATLHVLAREAVIRRPPSAGYTIGLTLLDRLKNDGTLQGIWGTFIFILGLRKLGD